MEVRATTMAEETLQLAVGADGVTVRAGRLTFRRLGRVPLHHMRHCELGRPPSFRERGGGDVFALQELPEE